MQSVGNKSLPTAIVYDFDGTLSRGNIQEHSFIPQVGMDQRTFWAEVDDLSEKEDADEILVYMQLMLEKAQQKEISVTAAQLRKHGRDAELFDGLADRSWFERINAHAAGHGLQLEHYIVSSGILEMIQGCPIYKEFAWVFASKFIYRGGVAAWPGVAINYTTKTQYLFRINKGIRNTWNSRDLNAFMPEADRRVPFERMIFLGDGDTDIPTMKMLSNQGGYAVAVYDPRKEQRDLSKIHGLLSDSRADFVAPADYTENSQLDIVIKGILGRIARGQGYRPSG
jgi:hypothetical protein